MSIDWSANGTTAITTADPGVGLPSGDLLELGYTTSSASAIQAAFASGGPTAVNALFTVWTTGYSTEGTDPTAPGTFSIATTAGNGHDSALFLQQIYLLAFNATTVGAATEAGVFAGAPFNGQVNANGDNWTYPGSDLDPAPAIEIADVQPSGVLLGAYGADTDPGVLAYEATSSFAALELKAVPEPSSSALVVLGLFGVIGLIRRRRQG